jgi:hypothetical protein
MIEEALAEQGKSRATATTLEKQIISMATRPRKDESDRAIVKQYWVQKSQELGIDYGPRSQLDGRNLEPRIGPRAPMNTRESGDSQVPRGVAC